MLCINGQYYNLKIIRKNNRNIYLRVKDDTLEITCPRWVNKQEILDFINEKSEWISKSVEKTQIVHNKSKIVINDSIYYLGKKYPLIVYSGRSNVRIEEDRVVVYCKDGTMENAINTFYKETKDTLLSLISKIEPKYLDIIKDYGYNQKPEYKVRILKSMWGENYTRRNQIIINEKMIHFSEKCLEAVLWHELLHFVIPNHSKRFHEVLDYHMPDYKKIIKSIF